MDKDIRWKQRFQNFERALDQLREAVDMELLSDLEKEGLIQRFEYTFELSWKTMKDFLESKGTLSQFPRDVIKDAFKAGIITDGETWMEMLDKRNLMAHTYNQENFNYAVSHIKSPYFAQIDQLYLYLKALI